MSIHPRRAYLLAAAETLRADGVAGGVVHVHRMYPFQKGQQAAVVVRYGSEAPDEDLSTVDADGRSLRIEVIGMARSDEALDELCVEIERAMAKLIGHQFQPLIGIGFGNDVVAEQPVFTAAHAYPVMYRLLASDPAAEI